MSLSVLNDDEFTNRLAGARSFLEGLKAEADARKALQVGAALAAAQEHLAEALKSWRLAALALEPWQYVNGDGIVMECSWCNEQHGHAPNAVSHGICPRHLKLMREDLQRRRAA